MLSVDEARARIIMAFRPLPAETVAIEHAHNRVLAEDARAGLDQPPAPVSAMDGYAVRAADNGPRKVVGSSPAGHPFGGKLGAGDAVRIFTGGVVPDGADTIVIQEDARADGQTVSFTETPQPGRHIRAAGLDFRKGDVLVTAGRRLTARDLSLLAAGDIAALPVRRRPVIALAATGDELSRPGSPRKPGGIVSSSVYGLSAMVESWGGVPKDLGILPDTAEAVATLPGLAKDADLLVTMGGASVGDHDLIRTIPGIALDFWKIAMRPGKPLIFGKAGSVPLLGADTSQTLQRARLAAPLKANDTRQDYLRARTEWRDGELWVAPQPVQDSSMLNLFAHSDVLIVRAPHAPAADIGAMMDIIPLQ